MVPITLVVLLLALVSPAGARDVTQVSAGAFALQSPFGLAIDGTGTYAYVTKDASSGADAVQVIDIATKTIVAEVALTLGGFDYQSPEAVAVSPDDHWLYVTVTWPNPKLVVIDLTTSPRSVTQVLTLDTTGNYQYMTFKSDGTAYIARQGVGKVYKVVRAGGLANLTATYDISANCAYPNGMAFGPGETTLFIACGASGPGNRIGRMNPANGTFDYFTLTASMPTPVDLVFNASRDTIYGALSQEPGAGRFTNPVGAGPQTASVAMFAASSYPMSIAMQPGDGFVLTANYLGDSVSVVNTASMTVDETITVPLGLDGPTRIAVDPTGTLALVTASASNKVYAIQLVPSVPTALAATAGDGEASIAFTAGSNNGSAFTNYQYSLDGGAWTALSPVDTTSPVTIPGLTNGTIYAVRLRAVNGQGNSQASAAVTVTPQTVPGAPTAVTATAGDGKVDVTWTAPASNGGSAITGYTVTGSPSGTCTTTGATTCTISGLANGTAYTFTATATNAVGTGSASSASSAVTPAGPSTTSGAAAEAGSTTKAIGSLTVRSTSVDGYSLTQRVRVSGPGVLRLRGTRLASHAARAVTGAVVCSTVKVAKAADTVRITCELNAAGRRAVARASLRIRITTTFTPRGGTATSTTRVVVMPRSMPAPPALVTG